MTEQPFRPRPGMAEVARAEQLAKRVPRRGNDPYLVGPEPERRTYSDPTADRAIAKVDRERRALESGGA